ncbi:MAG: hypothetical protein ABIN05_00685 [candidate division WOR-3 bacterium]
MKKNIFILLFLVFLTLNSSLTEWATLQISPLISKDPITFSKFITTDLQTEIFKSNLSFDFYNGGIFSYCFFENQTGRIGFGIEFYSDSLRDKFIFTNFNKIIKPVNYSLFFAKNFDRINAGTGFTFFYFDENYTDINSPFSNTKISLSDFKISPSLSFLFFDGIDIDLAGNISLISISSEKLSTITKTSNPFGYGADLRIKQKFNENFIGILFTYKNKSFGYQEIESGNVSGDVYIDRVDTLLFNIFAGIESFNYHNTYISGEYKKVVYHSKTIYFSSAEINSRKTFTYFPKVSIGSNFYITQSLDLNVGFSGSFNNVVEDFSPNLNPSIKNSNFNYDGKIGLTFKFENLKISLDFSKNLINIPFIISGKEIENISMNFGLSYSGFEF